MKYETANVRNFHIGYWVRIDGVKHTLCMGTDHDNPYKLRAYCTICDFKMKNSTDKKIGKAFDAFHGLTD